MLKYLSGLMLFCVNCVAQVACKKEVPFFQARPQQPYHFPEASSYIEWLEPSVLISLMQEQRVRFHHRTDADESEMIKRALPYFIKK